MFSSNLLIGFVKSDLVKICTVVSEEKVEIQKLNIEGLPAVAKAHITRWIRRVKFTDMGSVVFFCGERGLTPPTSTLNPPLHIVTV